MFVMVSHYSSAFCTEQQQQTAVEESSPQGHRDHSQNTVIPMSFKREILCCAGIPGYFLCLVPGIPTQSCPKYS